MTIGDAMRKARKEAGISMKELSFLSGVAYGTVQAMERGERTPSIVIVEACADALGIGIDEYIGKGENDAHK